jgi:ABC-type branched-subunit amino acid transport system substrate-binding protein
VRYPNGEPADDVIFVGSIMPTSPPYDTLVVPIQNATQLALDEFNGTSQLPGGTQIGWVACDSKGSADLAEANAMHLLAVGVPAIIGPILSEDVIQVAENVAIPNNIFMITPTGTNKGITDLNDDPDMDGAGLVWRPIASDIYQANALADRMNAVASLNSTTIVYKDDIYGTDLATDTFAALDGPLAAATTTHSYAVVADMMELQNNIGALLGQVIANDAPQTVVIVGTSEAALIMLIYLQVASQINPMLIPQKFIMSHGGVPAMLQTIASAPNDPTRQLLYSIMEGVAPVVFDPVNYGAFNIKYKVAFNDADPITTSSLSYDSMMVTAFAMAAIPADDPITGPAIAANIAKLVDPNGTEIDFGQQGFIDDAVAALSATTVDLKGISGPLDFDLETGDVRTNFEGWISVPIGGVLTNPTIDQVRLYTLNPAPATDGVWSDLP